MNKKSKVTEIAKIKLSEGNLVIIYWYDTIDNSSWTSVDTIAKENPALAKSVGWFLNQDDKCIRILSSVIGTQDSGMEAGYTVIPKAMLKDVEVIREDELDVEML